MPRPNAPFVPSPLSVVRAALALAEAGPLDVVVDLGCGDGRVAIIAAKYHGSRGMCVEIDEHLCALALANAIENNVSDRVEVYCGDMFDFDCSRATVVYAYLYGSVLSSLAKKLEKELRRGSRVLTLDFKIDGWVPKKLKRVLTESRVVRTVWLYEVGYSTGT